MHPKRTLLCTLAVTALALVASSPAGATATGSGGRLELLRASASVTLDKYPGTPVYLDVGAYVASVGGPFQLNVTRAGYRSPIEVRQIAGGESRALPAWVDDGWSGLRRFLRYTVRNSAGAVIWSGSATFCPSGFNMQRVDPGGPANRRSRSSAATTRSRWATCGGSTAAGRSAWATRRRRSRCGSAATR